MTVLGLSPLRLATLSVSTVAGLGLLGWYLDPDGSTRWMWLGLFLPTVWGYIELAQFRGVDRAVAAKITDFHRLSMAWAGLLLAVDVGADLAVANGLLGPEWTPIARRLEGIVLGAGLAIFGNYMPKLLSPWRLADEPFEWQRVHRFVGWVFSLAGVAVVLVWITLPLDQAAFAATRLVLAALALGGGRKLISLATHSPGRSSRTEHAFDARAGG